MFGVVGAQVELGRRSVGAEGAVIARHRHVEHRFEPTGQKIDDGDIADARLSGGADLHMDIDFPSQDDMVDDIATRIGVVRA